MAEFFSPTPEHEDNHVRPRKVPDQTAVTRTITAILMMCWLWWWWNGSEDGAYWVIAAVAIFATGETMPRYYVLLAPLWLPLSVFLKPIIFLIKSITRKLIPEAYRQPQKILKPLSFKEINEALDQAAEEQQRRNEIKDEDR